MNNTENKTLVSKFIEDFKKVTNEANKLAMVKKHVVTHYAPLLSKRLVLDLMNEKSVVNGKHGKYIDFTVSKLNMIMAVLALYTDLTPDKEVDAEGKETAKSYESYDLLRESGALDMILNEIGADVQELLTVQSSIMDTWTMQNTSMQAYISDLVEKVSMIFSTALGKQLEPLADMLATGTDEDKAELLTTLMENFKLNKAN